MRLNFDNVHLLITHTNYNNLYILIGLKLFLKPSQELNVHLLITHINYDNVHLLITCINYDNVHLLIMCINYDNLYLLIGPKLFVKPSQKSNRHIIINAIKDCCLAGLVNQDAKNKVLEVSA